MRVLSSMATKALLTQLLAQPDVVDGYAVELESGGGVVIADRIRDGEAADVAVLASGVLSRLASEGVVDGATQRPLFVSEVVVAVPAGEPPPPLQSVDDLRTVLLGADRIGYSTGPSGDGLLGLLDDWGVRDHLAERLVQAPAGVPVAAMLAERSVAVGVQQRSEFAGVDGVSVVGAFPPGCELTTVFAGAVVSATVDPDGASRILDRLGSADVGEIVRRHGMEPASQSGQ